MTDVQIVSDKNYLLGENPLWNRKTRELWWTDVVSRTVYSHNPAENSVAVRLSGKSVSSFAFTEKGGLICGCLDGLYYWSEDEDFRRIAGEHDGEVLRINDGIADTKGRFLFGTNHFDGDTSNYQPGRLLSLDNDGVISVLDEGIHLSNGLGFSTDDSVLYYTDTIARTIYRYRYDPSKGTASNREVFVTVPESEGVPDGLTVDSEGFVWSAQCFGASVARYNPDGRLHSRTAVPVKQVTSLAFGGDTLTDIFVTSAGENWKSTLAPSGYDYDAANVGGGVYRFKAGVKGRPEHYALISNDKR